MNRGYFIFMSLVSAQLRARHFLDAQDKFVELLRAQVNIPMVGINWYLGPVICILLSSSPPLSRPFVFWFFPKALLASAYSYPLIRTHEYFKDIPPLRPHFDSLASSSDNHCNSKDGGLNP